VHAANDHKSCDRKERIYELVKCLFDQFPTYNIKALFGEVTANYVGGDIFKQTIQDDNIHEIGHENGVIVLCQKKKSRPK
jgi:hypothetical protein